MRWRRRCGVLLAAVLTVGLGAGCSRSNGSGRSELPATPVLLVHGYSTTCPTDVTHSVWGGAYLAFTHAGWGGPVLPMSYYGCDRDGVDITGYGPSVPAGGAPTIVASPPRAQYDQNTSIDQLAHDLGWFVYDSFSRSGTPVDLVGASMGGLIIRDLLHHFAKHDAGYPPHLEVTHAVTFSTPHRGYGAPGGSAVCPIVTLECRQFAVGSALINELNADRKPPQGDGGTTWTVVGSSAGCDFVPSSSSLGMAAVQRVDYLKPCYGHVTYLWDSNPNEDATVRITGPDGAMSTTRTARHSLAWLVSTLAG